MSKSRKVLGDLEAECFLPDCQPECFFILKWYGRASGHFLGPECGVEVS